MINLQATEMKTLLITKRTIHSAVTTIVQILLVEDSGSTIHYRQMVYMYVLEMVSDTYNEIST